MDHPLPHRMFSASRRAASTSLLALACLFAAGSAAAASPGDTWSLTLTYDVEPTGPSIGSFTLGTEVAGQPGVFQVPDISVAIGPPGYAYDYDEPHPGLVFNTNLDLFYGPDSHVETSYGDQLDLQADGQWKTDDFYDPHPICEPTYCGAFHHGSYSVAEVIPTVPEPGSLGLILAALAAMVACSRGRRAA